jgi:hypothetical protein
MLSHQNLNPQNNLPPFHHPIVLTHSRTVQCELLANTFRLEHMRSELCSLLDRAITLVSISTSVGVCSVVQ